jgi:predicted nucleic acid-binding protein
MNKLLLDTNVFIYDIDKSSKYHESANAILNSDNSLYTTSKVISEYFAVLTKLDIKFETIWSYFLDIKRNVSVLYPNKKSLLVFENLMQKYQPTGNRIYDIEIASVMIESQIPLISTFNVKDFNNIEEIEIYKAE